MAKFRLISGGKSEDDDSENRPDYFRSKFKHHKKEREIEKKHHVVDVKEIEMRYKIEEHDQRV